MWLLSPLTVLTAIATAAQMKQITLLIDQPNSPQMSREDLEPYQGTCRLVMFLQRDLLPCTSAGTRFARLSLDSSSCLSGSTTDSTLVWLLDIQLLPLNWQDSSGDELLNLVKKVFNLLDLLIEIFYKSKGFFFD
ncbi:hypothetical protein Tco_0486996 [Tanacetum coccineum]